MLTIIFIFSFFINVIYIFILPTTAIFHLLEHSEKSVVVCFLSYSMSENVFFNLTESPFGWV